MVVEVDGDVGLLEVRQVELIREGADEESANRDQRSDLIRHDRLLALISQQEIHGACRKRNRRRKMKWKRRKRTRWRKGGGGIR